jgi:hypothetical protein
VILWEILTGKLFFGEIKFLAAIEDKILNGLRPEIPSDTNPEFTSLIQDCWHQDPAKRPRFSEVLQRLERIMSSNDNPASLRARNTPNAFRSARRSLFINTADLSKKVIAQVSQMKAEIS